jgi:lipoprotein-releasing system permease protein
LNTELFIAKKIYKGEKERKSFSRPISSIVIVSIALSLAVMIISVFVVTGFKKQITKRIVGFGSHIQLVKFDSNNTFETQPIDKNQELYSVLKEDKNIKHIQVFATKPGIIKTDTQFEGVVLKGIGSDFDWSFFKQNLVEGEIFNVNDTVTTNKVIISKAISQLLKLKTGDSFIMYFAQNPPRARKFVISGIFETSLVEFDKTFVLADIGHIQKLNGWYNNQISGFEITLNNFEKINEVSENIIDLLGYDYSKPDKMLKVVPITEKYVNIFDWLNLQDLNVWVILILMTIVSAINMISGLLILILDRINMIGILKAIGASNKFISKIFIYQAGIIVSKGLLWGNIFGILICLLQYYFGIIKLNPESYFLDKMPVNFDLILLILINVGFFILIMAALLIPSNLSSRIEPAKTIKYS